MTYPTTGGRGDAVVAVDFAGTGTYENWAGATNGKLSVKNATNGTVVGDSTDWTLPPVTQRDYGGQDISFTMDATWSSAFHKEISDWALSQKKLSVQITFPNAATGEVSTYTGNALLTDVELANIGAVDGSKITDTVTLEFDGTLTVVAAP